MSHNKNSISVNISGMHCKSCELLVEDNIKDIKNVISVNVDHKSGMAEIEYTGEKPNEALIYAAISAAGYEAKKDQSSKGTTKVSAENNGSVQKYKDLGLAALAVFGLYLIYNYFQFGDMNLDPGSDSLTLPLVLIIGLTAGVSTCMALVGGLVLGLSTKHNEKNPSASAIEKFRPHLYFNLGRIFGYALLGGLLGLLGGFLQLSTGMLGLITVLVGAIMLIMGLQLLDIFPWAEKLRITLPKSIARSLGIKRDEKEYSHRNAMVLGALTFFLPCGFTQSMQVYAIGTGSFFWGAVVMGLFAVGTSVGLLGIGGLGALVKGRFAQRFFKFAGLLVIMFALFNIKNGLGLAGFAVNLPQPRVESVDENVTVENGVQVIRMAETNRGYVPNKFTIRKGVPVKWIIDGQAPYSCASAFVVPSLDIRKTLVKGENIIEFTPKESGKIKFSCSMGMYTGVINVVDKDSDLSSAGIVEDSDSTPASAPTCGGSGGNGGGCGGCGGGKKFTPVKETAKPAIDGNIQALKTVYTADQDIQPNTFTVKSGRPVEFIVDTKDDGAGCMYQIKIPGLWDKPLDLEAGKKLTMAFTPKQKGEYPITCGMGMQRGLIIVE